MKNSNFFFIQLRLIDPAFLTYLGWNDMSAAINGRESHYCAVACHEKHGSIAN